MTPLATDLADPGTLRRTFGCFPSGVTAVCALDDGVPVGMAASSFTSVSLQPPLVSVCVAKTSATWTRLRTAPRLGINVLAAEHADLCRKLAARDVDRFEGVSWQATDDGAVFLSGSAARFECALEHELPAGDHDIVLFRVLAVDADPDVVPLVFHLSRFPRLEP